MRGGVRRPIELASPCEGRQVTPARILVTDLKVTGCYSWVRKPYCSGPGTENAPPTALPRVSRTGPRTSSTSTGMPFWVATISPRRAISDATRRTSPMRARQASPPPPTIRATSLGQIDVSDTLAKKCPYGRGNSLLECLRIGCVPPRLAAFTQRDLCIVDPVPSVVFTSLGGPSGGHQFVNEFLTKVRGDAGITRSPFPPINDEMVSVWGDFRGLVGWHTGAHSPAGYCIAFRRPPAHRGCLHDTGHAPSLEYWHVATGGCAGQLTHV